MVSPRKCLAMEEYLEPFCSPYIGGAQFYCMVHEGGARDKAIVAVDGITEALVPHQNVPQKPPLLANTKTNNYLLNALTSMYAEDRGGILGIGLDADGNVLEQATACVAFLGPDGVLRAPSFDRILEGTTLRRVIERLDEYSNLDETIIDTGDVFNGEVEFCDVTPKHVREAVEVISFGGGGVLPIVRLVDGDEIIRVGTGKPGALFKAIQALLEEDYTDSDFLDDIPYGEYDEEA